VTAAPESRHISLNNRIAEKLGSGPAAFTALFPVLENIARLAVQDLADRFQGIETDTLCFSGFQDGKVNGGDAQLFRQLLTLHFSPGKHHVQIDYNRHLI